MGLAHGCLAGWVRPREWEVGRGDEAAEWQGQDMARYGCHVACWAFSVADWKAWEHL